MIYCTLREDHLVEASKLAREGRFDCVRVEKQQAYNHFVFFGTESETSTCFETYVFPDDWEHPEPDEWYPTRPGKP
jgi:methylmalonyl-CoA/ethylmalonyl-CoA epimerase